MAVKHLTRAEFDTLVADTKNPEWKFLGDKPCIVDFFATWCGPCKALGPVLDAVADKFAGQIDVYKVDVDQENELAAMFQIRSVPTLIFVPKTGQPKMAAGAYPQSALEDLIRRELLA